MRVYEKVRDYIQTHGIKQVTIAKLAGIPNNTFNAILNGSGRCTQTISVPSVWPWRSPRRYLLTYAALRRHRRRRQ